MKAKRNVDRAVARLTESANKKKPTEVVLIAITHISAIMGSSSYGAAPQVQSTTAAWDNETKTLAKLNQDIADTESKLATLRADQLTSLRRSDACRVGVLNAITTFCDGSKDLVLSFGMSVLTRMLAAAPVVPLDLKGKRGKKPCTATVGWKIQPGSVGFMVQYATDPQNAATYSAPIPSTKVTFELAGQTPGATIYFRVATLDASQPTGTTEYTPWVAVMVTS